MAISMAQKFDDFIARHLDDFEKNLKNDKLKQKQKSGVSN